jgi:polyisoprenoid-binding protein YceI
MRIPLSLTFVAPVLLALPSWASETVLEFAPPQTQIHWTLGTLLHTVHGSFQLRSGSVRFDPATGKASGELIVDSVSGQSGSDSRDNRMRQSILEAPKFPAIVFRPDRVDGSIPSQGKAKLQVHGAFELHGKAHELTMPVEVDVAPGQVAAVAQFDVPYISWGLKNPSTLFLKVDDHVLVEIQATGRVAGNGTH